MKKLAELIMVLSFLICKTYYNTKEFLSTVADIFNDRMLSIMQDEFVDIVSKADEVIGSCSKIEAHQKGLLHRTVIAEIIRSNGDWVLVQQASDRQDAGQFVSPVGGHVRAGESEDDALKREAFEECGLSGELSFKLVGKKIFNRRVNSKKENHYFILYEIYTDSELLINHESVGFETFSKSKLQQQLKEKPEKFGTAFHFVLREFYPELLNKPYDFL